MDKHRDENGAIGETEDEVEAHARVSKAPLNDKTQVDEDDDEVEAHSPPIGQPPIGQPPIG
jgi:hypothetical protein